MPLQAVIAAVQPQAPPRTDCRAQPIYVRSAARSVFRATERWFLAMRATHTHGLRRLLWLAPCCVALSSCAVALQPGRPANVGSGALVISEARVATCPRSPGGQGATYREDLPGPVTDPPRMQALSILPPEARRTARAAGLEPLIADVILAWERAGNRPSVEALALRQQLDAVLASLQPQLLAVEFEAECNITVMNDALADRAGDRERWTLRYTVASLVAGAAAVLVAGIWDLVGTDSNAPLIAGLVGAAATTALGVAALAPPGRRIVFMHEQNLLAPIESGRDPDHRYPTFVFRLLTLPTPTGAPAPREVLIEGWRRRIEQSVVSTRRAAVASLLWGAGGVYDDDVLVLRRRLYEELESSVDSFARGVDVLTVTLAQVLGPRPTGTAPAGPS